MSNITGDDALLLLRQAVKARIAAGRSGAEAASRTQDRAHDGPPDAVSGRVCDEAREQNAVPLEALHIARRPAGMAGGMAVGMSDADAPELALSLRGKANEAAAPFPNAQTVPDAKPPHEMAGAGGNGVTCAPALATPSRDERGQQRTKPKPPSSADGGADSDMAGHRSRLRARFDRGERLADYELMELLLFRALPRRDTKPVAKALVREFGSFAAALSAPREQLLEIDGVGPAVAVDFALVRAAAERFTHDALAGREMLASTGAVVDYYRAKLRGVAREEFHICYLDKKNQFLASEKLGEGTVDHTPVYPREVLKRALHHGASAIVLVHNHPSGDPSPSRADVAVTRQIIDGAAPLGLAVHDHVIVGANTHVSLRGEGLI